MPRKSDRTSKEGHELYRTLKDNITSRLSCLGVSAYIASRESGHNRTWISDSFRRSSGVSLVWLADISKVLNVPPGDLLKPQELFAPGKYPIPEWLEQS